VEHATLAVTMRKELACIEEQEESVDETQDNGSE